MRISIIIPIFNIRSYLTACLDSCIKQTYKDLEIICVDDGSTDGSGQIADDYANRDTRIRVIHKTNEGLPSARRTGIDEATGEWLLHLDGDDSLSYDAVATLASFSDVEPGIDIVVGAYTKFMGDGRAVIMSRNLDKTVAGQDYLRYILKGGIFNIWGNLIKTSLYRENPIEFPRNISIAEDLVGSAQLATHADRIAVCPKPVYNYFIRESSMSKTSKVRVGELSDRSIFAVQFVADKIIPKLPPELFPEFAGFIRRAIYEYLGSPYPVSLRKKELQTLIRLYSTQLTGYSPACFADMVCKIGNKSLYLAKTAVKLSQFIRR